MGPVLVLLAAVDEVVGLVDGEMEGGGRKALCTRGGME